MTTMRIAKMADGSKYIIRQMNFPKGGGAATVILCGEVTSVKGSNATCDGVRTVLRSEILEITEVEQTFQTLASLWKQGDSRVAPCQPISQHPVKAWPGCTCSRCLALATSL